MIAIIWGKRALNLIAAERELAALAKQYGQMTMLFQGEISDLREQNLMLTRQMIDMKREGFEPIVPVSFKPEEDEREVPEQVEEAIARRAEPGTDLYRRLIDGAWKALEGGMDPGRVTTEVLMGGARKEAWDRE
jgi:hypothetical protein